jgi:hypothetical protein
MFLHHLIERALGDAAVIAPRRASRFEPAGVEPEPKSAPLASAGRAAATLPVEPASPVAEPRVVYRVEQVKTGTPEHVESFQPPTIAPRELREPAVGPPIPRQGKPLSLEVEVPQPRTPAAQLLPPPIERRTQSPPARPETIVRERVEGRVETHTIERRLERLSESHVEHVERVETRIERHLSTGKAHESSAAEARPKSTPIVPSVRQQPLPRQAIVQPPTARPEPSPAPTIHVTIGRVEVRAQAPAVAERAPKPRSGQPKLGLEEYLQRRERA